MSGTKPQESLHEKVTECRQHGYLLSDKKIGTGAFSKVYLGYATPNKISQNYKLSSDLRSKNHNMVAIKIISINAAPPEYSTKFLPREICAFNATYRHPGVIQLYDVFRSVRRVYLVLELALRGDLLEHINAASMTMSCSGLPEEQARHIFKQIVSAVCHCHRNRIAHRDLKCENILLDERGLVKLTDFGFANQYSDRNALMSTFCGSAAYTAPEILLSRKYSGEQADLWSLGVILYAMITGKLPYNEKHPRKLVPLIRKGLPFHHPMSQPCRDLLKQLLQWQPSARLPLRQISKHYWMALPHSSHPYKMLITKSDITDKTVAHEKTGACVPKAPPCQSGPGMCTSKAPPTRMGPGTCAPQTLPTWQCHISLPKDHKTVSWRQGSFSTCCHSNAVGKRRVTAVCACGPHPSPGQLLIRPSQNRASGPLQLFIRCPQPPSAPKPFHNLPNFWKYGMSPSREPNAQRKVCTCSGRSPATPRPHTATAGL